jgi:hypothetical protein
MKPQPAPYVPGETDAERFSNAVRKVFSVPAEAVQKERARMERARAKRKRAKAVKP